MVGVRRTALRHNLQVKYFHMESLGHSFDQLCQEPPTNQEETSIDMQARPITALTLGTVLLQKQTRGETKVNNCSVACILEILYK